MRTAAWAVFALAALAVAAVPAEAQTPEHLPHPPISIDSNDDFRLPGSGVVSGSGTAADPYVIEGWEFLLRGPLGASPPTAQAILLRGTTAHVVIRDVRVTDGGHVIQGVVLEEATNVAVVDSAFLGLNAALVATGSSEVRFQRNHVEDTGPWAVMLEDVSGFHADNNTMQDLGRVVDDSGSGGGVVAKGSQDLAWADEAWVGISERSGLGFGGLFDSSDDVTLSRVDVKGIGFCVRTGDAVGFLVSQAKLSDCHQAGLLWGASSGAIRDSLIEDSGVAAVVLNGDSNVVANNTLRRGQGVGLHIQGDFNLVQNNTITGFRQYGLQLDGFMVEGNLVRANRVTDNGEEDILVFGRLGSNVLEDNEGHVRNVGTFLSPAPGLAFALAAVCGIAVRIRRRHHQP